MYIGCGIKDCPVCTPRLLASIQEASATPAKKPHDYSKPYGPENPCDFLGCPKCYPKVVEPEPVVEEVVENTADIEGEPVEEESEAAKKARGIARTINAFYEEIDLSLDMADPGELVENYELSITADFAAALFEHVKNYGLEALS
jgi:hypothetical protein